MHDPYQSIYPRTLHASRHYPDILARRQMAGSSVPCRILGPTRTIDRPGLMSRDLTLIHSSSPPSTPFVPVHRRLHPRSCSSVVLSDPRPCWRGRVRSTTDSCFPCGVDRVSHALTTQYPVFTLLSPIFLVPCLLEHPTAWVGDQYGLTTEQTSVIL